jgi:hypothetical protein
MSDTRTTLTIALSTTVGHGTGWQSLANIDPGVPWRVELASAASETDQVEVWVSSDASDPVNYVGGAPPSGRRLVTLIGPNAAIDVQPAEVGAPAANLNLVRVAGVSALNALVTGGLATGGAGPAPGTYWAVGGQAGALTGGSTDGNLVTVGGLSAGSATQISAGATSAGIGIGAAPPGSQGTAVDSTTTVTVGANALTTTIGQLANAGASTLVMGHESVEIASSPLGEILLQVGNTVAPANPNGITLQTNGGPIAELGFVTRNVVAVANVALGGNIGTAAATVNVSDWFTVDQTTVGQALTLPNPTGAAAVAGRRVTVQNIGTQPFTMYGATVNGGGAPFTNAIDLAWDNTNARWVLFAT